MRPEGSPAQAPIESILGELWLNGVRRRKVIPFFSARTGCSACDGWSDGAEASIGTNPALACGTDAWPADITNDGLSDIFDIVRLTNDFAESVPPALARHDIAPDPTDGLVDIFDISRLTAFFGTSCTP